MIKSCSSFWENNPSNLSDKEVLTRYIQIAQNTAVERIKKDPVRTDFPLGQDLFFFFSVRMTEVFSAVFRIKIFYHSGCKDPSDYTPDIRRRIRSGGSRWGFFCAHCTACRKILCLTSGVPSTAMSTFSLLLKYFNNYFNITSITKMSDIKDSWEAVRRKIHL